MWLFEYGYWVKDSMTASLIQSHWSTEFFILILIDKWHRLSLNSTDIHYLHNVYLYISYLCIYTLFITFPSSPKLVSIGLELLLFMFIVNKRVLEMPGSNLWTRFQADAFTTKENINCSEDLSTLYKGKVQPSLHLSYHRVVRDDWPQAKICSMTNNLFSF